jgi:molecular chaperone DnaK
MKRIGIDLGTTNTVAAIDGTVLDLDPLRAEILPSTVAFPPSGATVVGSAARRRRPIDPRNTIFSAKRLIGRVWSSLAANKFRARYPSFLLVETGDNAIGFKTRAGKFTATDIAAMVLKTVASRTPAPAKKVEAIIAVPSLFEREHREATLEAGRKAGFGDVRIIDEPLATALAYQSKLRSRVRNAAVYDFGGGTFDLAIVDCSTGGPRVLGHGGDLYLGGDDIDYGLANWAADHVLETFRWDMRNDPEVFSRLIAACEDAKIRLQMEERARIDLTRVDPASPLATQEVWLDRALVAKLAQELVGRSFVICDQVLKNVGITAKDVDAVFVAGGATLLPVIREGIEGYFGHPVEYAFHPMHIVALGASLMEAP